MSHTSQEPRRLCSRRPWSVAALILFVLATAIGATVHRTFAERAQDHTVTPETTAAGFELFDKHVRDILVEHCVECHGGKETEADFDLTTRAGLLKGGHTDKAIVPGKSAESFLVFLIRHEDDPHMPEDAPKLPDAKIAHIAAWIDAGATYSAPLPKTPPKVVGGGR
jgi:mono/diheme cytochrome c family protein